MSCIETLGLWTDFSFLLLLLRGHKWILSCTKLRFGGFRSPCCGGSFEKHGLKRLEGLVYCEKRVMNGR